VFVLDLGIGLRWVKHTAHYMGPLTTVEAVQVHCIPFSKGQYLQYLKMDLPLTSLSG